MLLCIILLCFQEAQLNHVALLKFVTLKSGMLKELSSRFRHKFFIQTTSSLPKLLLLMTHFLSLQYLLLRKHLLANLLKHRIDVFLFNGSYTLKLRVLSDHTQIYEYHKRSMSPLSFWNRNNIEVNNQLFRQTGEDNFPCKHLHDNWSLFEVLDCWLLRRCQLLQRDSQGLKP